MAIRLVPGAAGGAGCCPSSLKTGPSEPNRGKTKSGRTIHEMRSISGGDSASKTRPANPAEIEPRNGSSNRRSEGYFVFQVVAVEALHLRAATAARHARAAIVATPV